MSAGVWVLVVAVAAALAVGAWRAGFDGRFRGTHGVRGADGVGDSGGAVGEPSPGHAEAANVLAGTDFATALGERATLLQFSSAFCAPCRATRHTLAAVADGHPGVRHLEVDAEHHLDLVRRLGVLRTPTTLVLDAHGREVVRASGAPTRAQVERSLAQMGLE